MSSSGPSEAGPAGGVFPLLERGIRHGEGLFHQDLPGGSPDVLIKNAALFISGKAKKRVGVNSAQKTLYLSSVRKIYDSLLKKQKRNRQKKPD